MKDDDNDEQSVIMASDTIIKKMNATVSLGDIVVGDRVVVIGAPNSNGQVEAHFIRVFPAPGPGSGNRAAAAVISDDSYSSPQHHV